MSKIQMVRRHRGSTRVHRDAYASWSVERQGWELADVFDEGVCDDCDGRGGSIVERPMEEENE